VQHFFYQTYNPKTFLSAHRLALKIVRWFRHELVRVYASLTAEAKPDTPAVTEHRKQHLDEKLLKKAAVSGNRLTQRAVQTVGRSVFNDAQQAMVYMIQMEGWGGRFGSGGDTRQS